LRGNYGLTGLFPPWNSKQTFSTDGKHKMSGDRTGILLFSFPSFVILLRFFVREKLNKNKIGRSLEDVATDTAKKRLTTVGA
jgi:hypothetical protein